MCDCDKPVRTARAKAKGKAKGPGDKANPALRDVLARYKALKLKKGGA